MRRISLVTALTVTVYGCATSKPPAVGDGSVGAQSCKEGEQPRCDQNGKQLLCKTSDAGFQWRAEACAGNKTCDPATGACPDLCGDCNTPPSGCYLSAGTCWNGECKYEPDEGKSCDDGDACTEGDSCAGGQCKAGKPKSCDQVPEDTCEDTGTLRAYAQAGSCKTGQCDYPYVKVPCPLGCEKGKCKGDPCLGKTCESPPSGCHRAEGICTNGTCTYLPEDGKGCDDNDPCSENDKCAGGKCAGTAKVCTTPPPNTCKDANTVVSHAKQGACTGGTCDYTSTEEACTHGCDAATGACKGDPCAGITCDTPLNACYKAQGTCKGGKCEYEADNGKGCNDGNPCTETDTCTDGVCGGSAVICNTPPANSCKDANTLTVNTAPGFCSAGSCNYGKAEVGCPFGCDTVKGICKGDPCATVTCDSPPNKDCYSVPGICSGGKCTYLPRAGASCNDGNPCTKLDKCDGMGGCAGTSYSCSDGLLCTSDTCDGLGGCTFPLQAGSCLFRIKYANKCYQSGEANADSACEHCDPTVSGTAFAVSGGTPMVVWGFDDAQASGFTFAPSPATSPVKWQSDVARKVSTPNALYFGRVDNHTYNDPSKPVSGEATSPSVSLPTAQGKLCLEFRMFKDTEETYYSIDQLTITAVPSGTLIWKSGNEPLNANNKTSFGSFSAAIPAALAGQSTQFRFRFDSSDSSSNTGEGVYLDDVRVLTNCTP
ncbi:MAG: hypothetical protein IT371_21530 [Deltaproteobacteria bacterium]|nr:hypothetical protein [Deltaproteobacteria bacterium]